MNMKCCNDTQLCPSADAWSARHTLPIAGRSSGILLSALIGALVLTNGCLVVPIPANRYDLAVRTNVSPALVTDLGPTGISRTDLLLRLGEPDEVSLDERQLRFHTARIKWDIYWVVIAGSGGAGGDIEVHRFYDLLVQFNNVGTLTEASWLEGPSPNALRETTAWPSAAGTDPARHR